LKVKDRGLDFKPINRNSDLEFKGKI